MEQKGKRCGNCGSFRVYYTMGYCQLLKEKTGYCMKHDKITERSDGCDKWYCRQMPKNKRARIAVKTIPEIYKKIAVVEQLLKEDDELKKLSN